MIFLVFIYLWMNHKNYHCIKMGNIVGQRKAEEIQADQNNNNNTSFSYGGKLDSKTIQKELELDPEHICNQWQYYKTHHLPIPSDLRARRDRTIESYTYRLNSLTSIADKQRCDTIIYMLQSLVE